jgi:excisionase family DNA binding protein
MSDGDNTRPQGETRLLNVREAAKYLGTTEKTLYSKVWRREIPFVKLGRSVRFDIRDLDAMIEANKLRPREHPLTPEIFSGGQ